MAGHATEKLFDALTTSIARVHVMAKIARRDAQALAAVAPSSNVRAAADAAERLFAAAEVAAAATAFINRQERAAQAQLYPTTGREVTASTVDPPVGPAAHVLGDRP